MTSYAAIAARKSFRDELTPGERSPRSRASAALYRDAGELFSARSGGVSQATAITATISIVLGMTHSGLKYCS